MNTLHRKLFRELWMIRGQVFAIAFIIACGLSTVIMSYNTLASLQQTREQYYQEYGFADLFASLKRAPNSLIARIQQIPGITKAVPRVLAPVRISLENFIEPIQGQLVSLDIQNITKHESLNRIYLREGRMPIARSARKNQRSEVLINEAFAQPHDLHPGDQLSIIINGHEKQLVIAGIALSPEFIYQIAPGSIMPDFSRYGVIWMEHDTLEKAYDMSGAFNDLSIKLAANIEHHAVIEQLDSLLKPYGGLGAYDRELQVSHHFLSEEFKQLDAMGSTFSLIFLSVTILLLNMLVSRIISTQKEIIASLKAFGYSNWAIGFHYSQLILCIVIIGNISGVLSGLYLGKNLALLYMDYYRFPYLDYQLQTEVILYSIAITLIVTLLGTLFSVRKATQLQPAEAMRPEPPQHYRITLIERISFNFGLKAFLSQSTRMILRHFERHPLKAFMSIFGTAFACAIMIVGTFFMDAMEHMLETEFNQSHKEDLTLTMLNPTSYKAIYELRNIPGVLQVEPYRTVAVKMNSGSHSHRTTIHGFAPDNRLHQVLDFKNRPVKIPASGILLPEFLTKKLNVNVGDSITIEVLEEKRLTQQVHIAGVSRQYIGLSGYMNINALNQLLREDSLISGAYLMVDNDTTAGHFKKSILKNIPQIAGVSERKSVIESFYKTVGDFILTYIAFITILSIAIAFGVIYNNARITLAERSRELASLRVMGYTQEETAYIIR
ncbi:MAG: ABC transporter permease [gamma proteobacterium symbiont of Bathyaustriella thionipta]|nr:ABC transporter permease [gamma proteobacterium symbiont of Bathyaustriella thionipta]MCU7950014.1 ABC transporter permease [gamma proteobacterium symbiont of Bathyaustriella thionipta]MCU7953813.1 ABC transporter permease [gamma proteobacterium symbiont of Bathyaustriella thionipta]MCU7956610.1 ABC transporter permease [gamma proteobacterium symbiont of Bathyaustriella thionipta]MCU7968598.1 ABC transporter permease [gamma proteobacterium symbiont of Bathyaustriella thionipta]